MNNYRLSYVYLDYSHEETIELSSNKEHLIESYNRFIADTLNVNNEDDVDYVSITDDNDNIIVEYAFEDKE